MNQRRQGMNDDDQDEIVDGDEGVINRRLPINSYNHQVQICGSVSTKKQNRIHY